MKFNIYYGGRGLVDDPTLSVLNRMESVFDDLHVTVQRFHLFEMKNSITTLPETLKDADGIILASTVEWLGIGGLMQEFLDACWLYGDKDKISQLYMCPVVMSTTYGEQEAQMMLINAWQILGGKLIDGICGFIENTTEFEQNQLYVHIIEKKAENMYRSVNQKVACLPASVHEVSRTISTSKIIDLTPQESEQLSKYVADDVYVQTQKEDIKELTSMFKDFLGFQEKSSSEPYIDELKRVYKPQAGMKAVYKFLIEGRPTPLAVVVNSTTCECEYMPIDKCDVEISVTDEIMNEVVCGRKTFQRSFMAGEMKMKGDFKTLRALDTLFPFSAY